MAKQLVSPVERHVDKGVLGVTVLALLGALALYGIGAPNQIELGTAGTVKPGEVEEKLAEKAKQVRDAIQRAPVEEPEVTLRFEAFEKAIDAFAAGNLPRELPTVLPFAAEPPLVGAPPPIEGFIELAKVEPLDKPFVAFGRSMIQLALPDGVGPEMSAAYQRPTAWITLYSVFDREAQSRNHLDEYAGFPEVYYGPIEVQRRERRADGSFSDEDWQTIKPLTEGYPEETPPVIRLESIEGVVSAVDEDFKIFEQYRPKLTAGPVQMAMIRPLFPAVAKGDRCRVPRPPGYSRRDILMMDDELEHPTDAPTDTPDDRYVDYFAADTEVVADKTLSPDEVNKKRFAEALVLRDQAERENSVDLVVQSNNLYVDIINDTHSAAGDKAKAKQLLEEGQQLKSVITRRVVEGERGAGGGGPKKPTEEQVYVRPLRPKQVVWAFDAVEGSLKPGATYQYRMRMQILNPYAGKPKLLKQAEDAAKVFVTGEWSEPTDPVSVPPDRQYFVTNVYQSGGKSEAAVEMFQWYDGVWVKGKAAFRFAVGELMAKLERVQVPPLDSEDPKDAEWAEVTFAADAFVLDVNADRMYPGLQKSGKLIKYMPVKQPVVAVVDADGRVHERLVALDKADPEMNRLKGEVWKPKSKKELEEESKPKPPPPKPEGEGSKGGGGG